ADIAPGTAFAIAVGQGGQGTLGGWGGGGDGGPLGNPALYEGMGGGGGSYVFFEPAGAPWAPFAVAGGGSGATGGNRGEAGGGANQAGAGFATSVTGGGGTVAAPGLGATGSAGLRSAGQNGTGPASYTPFGGLVPGIGGAGGEAQGADLSGGAGGGAGGGYNGGGGGGGGLDSSGFNGLNGGGGAGYLAPGFLSDPLSQPALPQNSSRNGAVTVRWQLTPATTSVQAGPSTATVGQQITLTATLGCVYGAEGGDVTFSAGGTALGTVAVDAATQTATIGFTPSAPGNVPIDIGYSGRGALCSTAAITLNLTATATPAPNPGRPDEIARTGSSDSSPLLGLASLLLASALLVSGGVSLLVARRTASR
ncbi:MAG: Ig-like domain-containing protein, partial [Leucobacter sp.]